jgi:hypothetical protein
VSGKPHSKEGYQQIIGAAVRTWFGSRLDRYTASAQYTDTKKAARPNKKLEPCIAVLAVL